MKHRSLDRIGSSCLIIALVAIIVFGLKAALPAGPAAAVGKGVTAASASQALPERGQQASTQAAVRQLKAQGQYDSLAAAFQKARYSPGPVKTGSSPVKAATYSAANAGNGFRAWFGPGAVHVRPRKTGGEEWEWSVRLTGYGYRERLQQPAHAEPVVEDGRIEYRRGAITEWYVNDPKGLEQGFTLAERPAGRAEGSESRLTLTMSVGNQLEPRLDVKAGAVKFLDSQERVQLQYAALKAWDATGRELPAEMQSSDRQIALLVDDRNASYPVTIDPLVFAETKLTASDAAPDDSFGGSVAISGDTVVVGAPFDDDKGDASGSAYVFVRSGSTWTHEQKLTADDATANDFFGLSVAISDHTVVVGAPGDNNNSGSAYVFVRGGLSWTQQQKLTASDAAADDSFGGSVAISGDSVVVGAASDDDPAVGLNVGSAYVFVRGGSNWTQQLPKLIPSDVAPGDGFGGSVAISGNTMVVGAEHDNVDAGSAYVFVLTGSSWSPQLPKLIPSDVAPGDRFGGSVAISGDIAVVGAADDDDAGDRSGSAYVYVRSGSTWAQRQKLIASDAAALDNFGRSVAISGDALVVGAPGDNTSSGSAYVFWRSGSSWTQQQPKLTASDAAANDAFGGSVAISGDTVVVGASGDELPAAGVDAGSAHVFALSISADLMISLGVDKTNVRQGDLLTYTLTARNFGPTRAFGVVVNDTMSTGTTFVSARANKGSFTGPPAGQTGTVTWFVGEMLNSDREDAQLRVTVIARGRTTITNSATVGSYFTSDPNPANNSASIAVSVSPGSSGKK